MVCVAFAKNNEVVSDVKHTIKSCNGVIHCFVKDILC